MKEKILSFFKRVKYAFFFILYAVVLWFVTIAYPYILRKLWKYRKMLSLWLVGYRWITMHRFLDEFKPRQGHSKCNGKGYFVVKAANGFKRIAYCACVWEPYQKSGKKYMMKDPTL